MSQVPEIQTKSALGARVGDLLKEAARARFIGRERELALLARALLEEESPAVFVHGIGGIGKTSLLDALEPRLEDRGARVLRLDGHDVEPTPEGLLWAVGSALGTAGFALEEVAAALSRLPDEAVVIAIDEYDALRLLDAFIRRTFLPSLPARARMLFAGRSRPVASWTAAPGRDALVRTLELGPLPAEDAARLVLREAVPEVLHARICAIGAGHPLALKLAAAAVAARPDLPLGEVESRHVVGELVRRFLSDIEDPKTRAAVEAASVLRRVTRPLLASMLGEPEADQALATLARLPFVETAADGLVVHQSVRNAVATTLRALDPARHRELRMRAWRKLEDDVNRGARKDRNWQLTADIIYLVDDPNVRDAYFPSDTIRYGVEPALPDDRDAIFAIARTHACETESRILEAWWELRREAFLVVRDENRRAIGFYLSTFDRALPDALLSSDPLLARWVAHARATFSEGGRPVIFLRAMLSAAHGTGRSEERASCFLDAKRSYMERLDLAAIYTAHYDGSEAQICDRIGFEQVSELTFEPSPGFHVTTAVLAFGTGVLQWLARIIDAQLDPASVLPEHGYYFCRDARALFVDRDPRPLTRLEFGLLDHLERHKGSVATRDALLASVWGQAHTGSNVVDAVVRSLRRKLGPYAGAIQTVTGHGYMLRSD